MNTNTTLGRLSILLFLLFSFVTQAQAQFEDSGQRLLGVGDATVAWADYDLDGDLDAFIAGESARGPVTRLYKNNNGSFQAITNTPFIGVTLGDLAFGDFDNDNDPDLLLTGRMSNGQSTTQMYRNDGGTFIDINAGITALSAGFADWGDFDSDGDLDFVITGVDNNAQTVTKIYRNNDGASFTEVNTSLLGVRRGDGGWIDFDQDGDADLLLTGRDTQDNRLTRLYINEDGAFTESGIDLPQVDLSAVAWGHHQADRPQEVLIAGTSDQGIVSQIYADLDTYPDPFRDELTSIGAGLEGLEFASAA